MTRFKDIGVIGGGAWGTALAATAQRAGAHVTLWAREAEVVESITARHENAAFLPGIALHPSIRATGDLGRMNQADAVLLVVPAQYVRATTLELAKVLPDDTPVVIAAKGVEMGSGATMGEVLAETLPRNPFAVLSGPTFAIEVAQGRPTAVTLASSDQAWVRIWWRPSAPRPSDPISATIRSAARSAAPSRTCWRSPAASSRGGAWATMPVPPSSPGASLKWCGWPSPRADSRRR